ncbi:ABC transporter permease [uncultured Tenacibaculum sp.]|uniref:ABC transporter permease n=1 Tax=uncultured Tenacibaculum sp. TaxID=174713 RepID=UPI002604C72E|nr:ABC transporter permease [uncultured Tenacibaculum sp.]
MKKLKLIIKREFIAKVKNRSFIIMTFLSPFLMVGMGALVFFLTKKNDEKVKKIVFVDESGVFSDGVFKDSKTVQFEDYTKLGIEETKKKVEKGNYYGAIYIPKKDSLETIAKSIEFYSKDSPSLTVMGNIEGKVESKLKNLKLTSFGIDLDKIKKSRISADIKMFNFSGEKSSKAKNVASIIAGGAAGYLLFMFVLIYGTSVMRSVIEEKTSRIIEVIVSSVKPFQLMLGKIIGNASAGLLQFFIWGIIIFVLSLLLPMILGINISDMQSAQVSAEQMEAIKQAADMSKFEKIIQGVLDLPLLKMFVLFIFYFFGGYMLYSSLFAAIGAAVDSETDSQQFMTPIMLPLILGVYVGFFTVINDPHGPISVIFSYIPFTSPIVMLMRIPFGVAWWEILVSLLILILTFMSAVWIAAKIYRVGILMYGKKANYKDLWKWIRYSS